MDNAMRLLINLAAVGLMAGLVVLTVATVMHWLD